MPKADLPPVDIIIPIFNQPEWTERCIRNVFERTNGIDYRIISINDGSTDVAIHILLETLAAEHPERMIVLRNDVNAGLVQTVNRGIRFSDRDVVLLNTDTEVSTGWLSHMAETAYADARIASVTPLSNEASMYSIFTSPCEREYVQNVGVEE